MRYGTAFSRTSSGKSEPYGYGPRLCCRVLGVAGLRRQCRVLGLVVTAMVSSTWRENSYQYSLAFALGLFFTNEQRVLRIAMHFYKFHSFWVYSVVIYQH